MPSNIEYVPKWKWFRPPQWKIFSWAYCYEVRFDLGSNKNGREYKSPSVEWVPKWDWFKPPKWKIFRWAYYYKTHITTSFTDFTEMDPVVLTSKQGFAPPNFNDHATKEDDA